MSSRPTRRRARAAAVAAGALALASLGSRPAGAQTRLLRSPTVSATQVAFAYAGNLWIVDRAGGSARRLTSGGSEQSPKLSPDGRWVAFSADYGGNTDVYVVSAEGGEPKRLTWHPSPDVVQGWSPDGARIVFSSTRSTAAPSAAPRFWTVAAAGGVEEPMPMPRAYQGKISPDGKRVAYRMNNSWDEERRNYRGGQNRPIWIMDLASHEVTSPTWTDSKDMDPVWVGDDVVAFISDRDGVANVWSWNWRTKSLAQLTHFRDFDVKTLDAAKGVLVFEQGGQVHEMAMPAAQEHVIAITANGDFPWMMPQWKDVTQRASAIALSPTGRRAAVEARGDIFTVPAEKGDVRDITHTSGAAEIAPAWSPDGRWVSYFGDASGEYRLYIAPQDGMGKAREIALPEPSHPYAPAWSPDSRRIAFQDSRLRLWSVDVASGKATVADADPYFLPDRTIVPVWSPDSRWIAYPKHLKSLYRAIFLYSPETGEKRQITDGLADATSPAWDASGKYLWFLASTNYALNSGLLDMSAYDRPETKALYLMVLAKGTPSPLLPESDEEAARAGAAPGDPQRGDVPPRGTPVPNATPGAARADSGRAAGDTAARAAMVGPRSSVVRIDFDGLQRRIVPVGDVALRDYVQLRAGAPGTVFFLEPVPATGTATAPAVEGVGTVHRYQLSTRKAAPFVQGAEQYVVSADGRKLLYRLAGPQGGMFLVDADKAAPAAGQGRLNATLRMYVDPKAEFAQIFAEGWRNERNNLYVQNMHGTDWAKDREMYGALLPSVRSRADLNYLLDMMGAEIAIGHSYVRGGDMGVERAPSTAGLLGADLAVENGRYRITRIYESESWNPELRAPLAMPGVNVSRGDYLLAVNGVPLDGSDNVYRLLDGTANRQTVLTVNARPTTDGARQVTVIPVANEQGLRTRAWVENNRRLVDSLSGGKLAYVYLPNTGQPGYQSFNRYYFAQQDRQGAVIDERYNGGGSAADYIIDLLGRTYDGYFNNPVGERYPFTSPSGGIWGPKVMIINEMAGSGGDLMPYMFRYRKLGPLVGKRTWGGLVATTDTPPFVDGGSMIAPRFGFFAHGDKWAVENEGVAPDVDVENWPKDVIAGHDPQLEAAVSEALKLLAASPSTRATHEPAPPTWGRRTTQ